MTETSSALERLRSRIEGVANAGAHRAGRKLLLGVIHLRALPGSPGHDVSGGVSGGGLRAIVDAARTDLETLLDAGFDGYVIENFGDVPFFAGSVPPWVIATMARIATELDPLRRGAGAYAVANVLRNDALGALGVAVGAELDAIRVNVHSGAMVTDQGIVEGRAAETTRARAAVAPHVAILADVDVKHAAPLAARPLGEVAKDTAYRGLADALIVTGAATGSSTSLDDLRTVRAAVPDRPLLVGSGANAKNASEILSIADGVIVASALKPGGRASLAIDVRLAREFVRAARG